MIRNWLRNFMFGRYGPDQLCTALIIASCILLLISKIIGIAWLIYVGYLIFIIALYRFCSRNIEKRRSENDRFIGYWWPVKTHVSAFFKKLKSRKDYKYFKCPSCKNTLRVPRGKGRIQVTCPKCGERFIKKT